MRHKFVPLPRSLLPLDINVTAHTMTRMMELVSALRIIYPGYENRILLVMVGALGAIPISIKAILKVNMTELFKAHIEQRTENQ